MNSVQPNNLLTGVLVVKSPGVMNLRVNLLVSGMEASHHIVRHYLATREKSTVSFEGTFVTEDMLSQAEDEAKKLQALGDMHFSIPAIIDDLIVATNIVQDTELFKKVKQDQTILRTLLSFEDGYTEQEMQEITNSFMNDFTQVTSGETYLEDLVYNLNVEHSRLSMILKEITDSRKQSFDALLTSRYITNLEADRLLQTTMGTTTTAAGSKGISIWKSITNWIQRRLKIS